MLQYIHKSPKWPTLSSIMPQSYRWKCSTSVPNIPKIMIAAANITSCRILCTSIKWLIICCLFIRLVTTTIQYGTEVSTGTSNFQSLSEHSGLYLRVHNLIPYTGRFNTEYTASLVKDHCHHNKSHIFALAFESNRYSWKFKVHWRFWNKRITQQTSEGSEVPNIKQI